MSSSASPLGDSRLERRCRVLGFGIAGIGSVVGVISIWLSISFPSVAEQVLIGSFLLILLGILFLGAAVLISMRQ